jgi:hypothetical protein
VSAADSQLAEGSADATAASEAAAALLTPTASQRQELAQLLAAFADLPPFPDPLNALYDALPDQSLSYDALLACDDALRQAVGANDDETEIRHGVIRQCYRLTPIPLPAAPLGY